MKLGKIPNFLLLNNGKFEVKESNLKRSEQMYMYRDWFGCIDIGNRALIASQEEISNLGEFEHFWTIWKIREIGKCLVFFCMLMST
jgi:hypothetical protein